MNRSVAQHLLVLLGALLVVAGCGGAKSKQGTASERSERKAPVVKTMIGAPLEASTTVIVIAGKGSERVGFNVRPEDAQAVDTEHVRSHIGVPNLAFEITYVEVDGAKYATAAEEVTVEAAQ